MKRPTRLGLLISLFLQGLAVPVEAQSDELRLLKWGLKGTGLFEESVLREDASSIAQRRYFKPNNQYFSRTQPLVERHFVLWDKFRRSNPGGGREEYSEFIRRHDPFLAGSLPALAPVLSFKFTGVSGKEYVLEDIEIETLAYKGYKGAGFFDREGRYDIVLSHTPGIRRYPIDSNLRFTGSGQADLRFWSDNYIADMGTTPMGRFTLRIVFRFRVDGIVIRLRTDVFMMDV